MKTIEERLEALERTNRRLRSAAGLLAAVFLAAVGMSAADPQTTDAVPGVLRAKRIEVLGDDGRVQVALDSFRGVGVVTTYRDGAPLVCLIADYDAAGNYTGEVALSNTERKTLVHLGASEAGGLVTTYNRRGELMNRLGARGAGGSLASYYEGKQGVALGATPFGGGVVVFNDREETGLMLSAGRGFGDLTTYDGRGRELVALGATDGGGLVSTFNRQGRPALALSSIIEGKPLFSAFDSQGRAVVYLGTGRDGKGFMEIFSEKDKELVRIGSDENGDGFIGTFNSEGEGTVALSAHEGSGVLAILDGKRGPLVSLGRAARGGYGMIGIMNGDERRPAVVISADADGAGRVTTLDRAGNGFWLRPDGVAPAKP